jgi:hypothetical protein
MSRIHKLAGIFNYTLIITSIYTNCRVAELTIILAMWRIGLTPNSIPIYSYIQQDATLHSLFISGNCFTCFGWYFHPLSGAHTTVFECAVGGVRHPQHTQTGSNSSTIAADSSKSAINTRRCT